MKELTISECIFNKLDSKVNEMKSEEIGKLEEISSNIK